MDKLEGYEKYIDVAENSVFIEYDGILSEHWNMLLEIAIILSNTEIGPKIYKIDNVDKILEIEKVNIFETEPDPDLFKYPDILNKIKRKIDEFHELGLIHGDLGYSNVGYRNKNGDIEIVLIDYDTMHFYKNAPESFRENFFIWLYEQFDIENYEDYVDFEKTYQGVDY